MSKSKKSIKKKKQKLQDELLDLFISNGIGDDKIEVLKKSRPIIKLSNKIFELGYKQGIKQNRKNLKDANH